MATIVERRNPSGKSVYRVQYRLKGQKSLSQTFRTEKEAKQYITVMDARLIQDRHNALLGIKTTLFSQVIERYIDEVQYTKMQETRRTERAVLRFWSDKLGHMLVSSITSQHISKAIRELMDSKAQSTARRYVVILNHALNKAVQWDYISKSPMVGMRKPPIPQGRDRCLRLDEVQRLLKVCQEDENRNIYPMVVFALSTGCRLGELQRLEHSDIQGNTVVFEIRKKRRKHAVPIRSFLAQVLAEYYDSLGPANFEMFDKRKSNLVFQSKHGSPAHIRRCWDRVRRKALLEDDVCWHTLRHTTASFLLQQGYPLAVVAKVLGHRSIASSARYAHLEQQHIGKVLEDYSRQMFGE